MNRHAPLFRVALVTLLMAVGLPALVFITAQVRARQLQSKANPRWSQFQAVNGVRSAEPTPVRPLLAASQPNRIPDTPDASARDASGSTAAKPQPPELRSAAPASLTRTVTEAPARKPSAPPPRQVATTATVNVPVPLPDEPEPEAEPVRPPKPTVQFRTLEESRPRPETDRQLEARLAGLQQRLDQLAQLQTDKQFSDLERTLNLLKQVQQNQAQQGQQILQSIPGVQNATGGVATPAAQVPAAPAPGIPGFGPAPATGPAVPPVPAGPANAAVPRTGREPSIRILQNEPGDEERFSIQVQDANLTEVLEMLGQLAGVNILTTREVAGRVSLNLQEVTVDAALDAILKSQGFVHEREGDFIYVRTSAEAQAIELANRKLVTKVYQLHYIAAAELQKLIDPVLTKGVGRQAVTSPPMTGIAPMPSSAGGDGLAGRDTLLVQDYPDVIEEIDKIVIELDVPPLQVMIEAKILSVALSDTMAFGVNFAMLNGAQNSQVLSGNGAILNGAVGFPDSASLVPATGDFLANTAGLKYGFIQGDVSGFIRALETIADVNLVAAPQLRVLNKQKAEMIIGERLSYKTLAFNGTQTIENVQFLDAGTKLIFRPFISPDGMVRLEVHPERSKATINETTGLPNSETTEVTTNVMVRDGTTVVLGGLISEESSETIERVPFLGAIPVIGTAFRNKSERVQRNELIVLITPRVVTEPESAIEGETLKFETQQRAAYFRDHLSPINRTSLTRAHYERACHYYEQGNLLKAKQQIEAALRQHRGDLECQRLKLQIDQALQEQQSRIWKWPKRASR